MISLEQVKLLESKVTRTIDYVRKVSEENTILKGKLDSYQKRIDELEVLVLKFKEEQSRIEEGILSALDRLNQFEDAVEGKLSQSKPAESKSTENKIAESKPSVKEKRELRSSEPITETKSMEEEEKEPNPATNGGPAAPPGTELDIF